MTARLSACIAATALACGGVAGVAEARSKHKHPRHHHAKRHAPRHSAPPPRPPAMKPESFDGSCEFSGAVSFTPPMTTAPQPVAQHADAPGACTGTFVDEYGGAGLDHFDLDAHMRTVEPLRG